MATEHAAKITDIVTAELVECQPDPEPSPTTPLPVAPETTPVQDTLQATIEQTGADPPPCAARDAANPPADPAPDLTSSASRKSPDAE